MTITFLGTGTSQGVPVIGCDCEVCRSLDFRDKRLRVSVHVQVGEKSLVIDTGPDFRQQALRARIARLDAVLMTHEHKDHTAGLDDVRAYNFRQQRDMPVYGRATVLEQIKREFSYAFADKKYRSGVGTSPTNPARNGLPDAPQSPHGSPRRCRSRAPAQRPDCIRWTAVNFMKNFQCSIFNVQFYVH